MRILIVFYLLKKGTIDDYDLTLIEIMEVDKMGTQMMSHKYFCERDD